MKEELDPIVGIGGAPAIADVHTSNPAEIFPLCKECLQEFQKLLEALEEVTFDEAMERGYVVDTALTTLEEAQSRFKAWAVNIAAFQRGHLRSSLDFRLKDATEIRTRIWKILKDLVQSLSSAFLIVTGAQINETWGTGALSGSEDEVTEPPSEDVVETSDLQELFAAIKAANTSLMKMSMVIRNSPSRDDYLKAATRYPFDAMWDIGHVKQKHGSENQSNNWLLERLGKAITRRRQYLKYREDHHGKLSRDWVDELPKEVEADSEPTKTIDLTEATKYVENDAPNRQAGSEGGGSFGSQTSYEATIAGESTEIRLTVPPVPKMAFQEQGVPFVFGEVFQCPYCYTEQTVKNKAAWKKHVFRDLKPYVCTFRECNLRMFSSRNEWFAHELQTHRREWTCSHCEAAPFLTKASFQTHLKATHKILLMGSELEAMILQSEEPVSRISLNACDLCDNWRSNIPNTNKDFRRSFSNGGEDLQPYGTLKQFRRHLGRHMEQLALFALPINGNEEVNDESLSDDEGGADLSIDGSEGERVDLIDYLKQSLRERLRKAELRQQNLRQAKGKSPEDESANAKVTQKPIRFKDAVGRKFSFPFHLCQTWAGMEELIRQAFEHVEVIGPHVMEGHYDLIGPNGEIILPQVWETMIEPDWAITMHMWPIPEPPKGTPLPPGFNSAEQPTSSHGHRVPPGTPPPASRFGFGAGPVPPPPPNWPGRRVPDWMAGKAAKSRKKA